MNINIKCFKYGDRTILIDDDDFEKINKFKWYVTKTVQNKYYISTSKGQTLHRFIIDCPRGMEVDHINGNTFDNRKENLRICSHSQNCKNRIKSLKESSSMYKGVSLNKRDMLWHAYIRIDRTRRHLGYFENENEAAIAYNKAALMYYGDFANLNIISINP